MRVLVTGNDGYIGSVLTSVLLAEGMEVDGLDVGFFAEADFADPPPAVRTQRRDLRDVEAGDLAGYDAVVHLAALSNDPLGEIAPGLTYEINHRASVRLAELARDAGVGRFLYSSSCSLYGKGTGAELTEGDEINPQTAYARSKILAEEGIRALAGAAFSPVFLRNGTAYGVSPRQRFDLMVPNLCGWAHTTGKVNILSDGTPWRPLVHIRDIAEAFRAALVAPREAIHNQAFNVGRTGENFQVRAVAEMVRDAFPGSEVTFGNPKASPDSRDYRVSFAKIERSLPGYHPTWRLRRGIDEFRDHLVRVGLTKEQFESRLYTRLKQLKYLMETARTLGPDLRWSAPEV